MEEEEDRKREKKKKGRVKVSRRVKQRTFWYISGFYRHCRYNNGFQQRQRQSFLSGGCGVIARINSLRYTLAERLTFPKVIRSS